MNTFYECSQWTVTVEGICLSIIIIDTPGFAFAQPGASDSSSATFTVSWMNPFAATVQQDGTCFILLASSNAVQCGNQIPVISFCQPHAVKLGIIWWIEAACFQKKLAWTRSLSRCSKKAACVGGMFSKNFLPLVNRQCLASLTLVSPHPLLYMMTTISFQILHVRVKNRGCGGLDYWSMPSVFLWVLECFAKMSKHILCHIQGTVMLCHTLLLHGKGATWEIWKVPGEHRYHGWWCHGLFCHSQNTPTAPRNHDLKRSVWQGPPHHYQQYEQ